MDLPRWEAVRDAMAAPFDRLEKNLLVQPVVASASSRIRRRVAGDGLTLRRPQQRCVQMRVPVAVMPRLLMAIIATARDEFVQAVRQILLQPGLELNGADRGGAAHVEHVHRAGLVHAGSNVYLLVAPSSEEVRASPNPPREDS